MIKKAILVISIITVSVFSLYAGKAPIKFGKINKAALEMNVCSLDSSAAAVVLCDYGYFNGTTFNFTRILRIKILKKEGLNWANNVFRAKNEASIKGITYNLVDGEIVESKLKKSQIFTERVYEDYYRQRVSMPNVEVGSVIDIQTTYVGFPTHWYFQKSIPVLISELVIEPSTYVSFNKNFFGYVPLDMSVPNTWIARNVPAFKEEPFMNSTENYITKFEFDIKRISYPGLYINVTSDWEGLSHTLLEMSHFGVPLKAVNMFLRSMAKEIKSRNLSDKEKIIAAIDTLHSIKWNGDSRLMTTETELRYQFGKEVGNSADINIGLVVLLRKLGFETYPVVLSTKSNGLLSIYSPSYEKLNYVVALAKVDNEFILLDASDELLPYNLLPSRCLNQRGRIIDRDTTAWVAMEPQGKYKTFASYNLNLDNEFNLTGTLTNAYYDYAAYNIRKDIDGFTDLDEYIDSKVQPGLIINNAEIQNIENIYLPVKETYDVSLENVIIRTDSMVYLSLMPFNKLENNPFNNEERLYPVDFTYPRERSGTISITLPENVEVIETPEPIMLTMPDKSIDYVYSITQLGKQVILNYRMRIIVPQIYVNEYPNLSMMYQYIIEKEDQPIILKLK